MLVLSFVMSPMKSPYKEYSNTLIQEQKSRCLYLMLLKEIQNISDCYLSLRASDKSLDKKKIENDILFKFIRPPALHFTPPMCYYS